jgi:hypothetical protein
LTGRILETYPPDPLPLEIYEGKGDKGGEVGKCKMSKEEAKAILWGVIGATIVCLLGLALPFILSPKHTFLERIGLAQLSFSAIAFFAIFIALVIAIAQFLKSMAKPKLSLAFSEDGKTETSISDTMPLWIINKGNAVARYFQINFIIPENIGNPSVSKYLYTMYISFVKDNSDYILSYTNEGRYTLFVNKPYSDPNMIFWEGIDTKKCIEVYKDSCEIKYRVYGDWAETQEGKLKVNIHKQQEAT